MKKDKTGLVLVLRPVHLKTGTSMQKRWCKVSELKPTDKIISRNNAEGDLLKISQRARQQTIQFAQGTVVSFKKDGKTVKGLVSKTLLNYNVTRVGRSLSCTIEVQVGNKALKVSPETLTRVSKKDAERFLKRDLYPVKFFNKDTFTERPKTELEVMEEYKRLQISDTSYDEYKKKVYFESDGYTETANGYKENGQYLPNRKKIHNQIIDEVIKSGSKPPQGMKPVCYLMGGGSGVGKSSVADPLLDTFKRDFKVDLALVDCDKVKAKLPEHEQFTQQNKDNTAVRLHRESSEITEQILSKIVESGVNFVYDGTMKSEDRYVKLIKRLREEGYEVRVIGVDIPIKEAKKRAIERFKKEERRVPEDIIEKTHKGFAKTFFNVAKLADYSVLYDNSQPLGQSPTLLYEDETVKNESLYKRFKKKGEPENEQHGKHK